MERAGQDWELAKLAADEANKELLKGSAAGAEIVFYQYRDCLFLGEDQVVNKDNVKQYRGAWGTLKIGRKGEWKWSKAKNDPGSIELINYQGNFNQEFFAEALNRISKKSVDYEVAPTSFWDFWAVEPWEGAHAEFEEHLAGMYAGENIYFLDDLRKYRNDEVDAEVLYTRYFEEGSDFFINIDSSLRNEILEAREDPGKETFDVAEQKVIDDMVQDLYGKWKIMKGY